MLYFFYKKTENIIPHWYSFARDWYLVRQASRGKAVLKERGSDLIDSISHGVKEVVAARRGSSDLVNDERNNTSNDTSYESKLDTRVESNDSLASFVSALSDDGEARKAGKDEKEQLSKDPERIIPFWNNTPLAAADAKPDLRFAVQEGEGEEDESEQDENKDYDDSCNGNERARFNRRASLNRELGMRSMAMVLQARDADDVSSVFSTIPSKLFILCTDPPLSP